MIKTHIGKDLIYMESILAGIPLMKYFRYAIRKLLFMSIRKNLFLFLFTMLIFSACNNSVKISLRDDQKILLYQPITFQIEGIKCKNAFNPDSIKADLIVTSPSGKIISVPAFAFKEVSSYETDTDIYVPFGISKRFWEKQKMLNAGQKVVRYKPTGAWKWNVMFNPSDTGEFKAHLEIIYKNKKQTSNEISFIAKQSDLKGFVRIAKANPKALEYDNGENFIPIGNDLSYALTPLSKDRLAAYKEWLSKMNASHANIIRLWPGAEWCFGVESGKPYNYNQEASFLLDSVFKMCEENNIHVILCLDYVRRFKKAKESWVPEFEFRKDYPYLKANGGTCKNENDFLLRDDAKRQWQSYMRYVIARWGAYTSLFSVQLWNEMNCFESKREYIIAWSNEMCGWLKDNDPYHHLRTNSLGSATIWPELWSQKNIDYISYHDYGGDRYTNIPMYDVFADSMRMLSKINKPLLMSECGLVDKWLQYSPITHPKWDSAGPKDSAGYAFHEALWIGLMSGGAGSGMHWWWDVMVNDFNYYPQYEAFYNLTKDVPTNKYEFGVSKPETNNNAIECFARTSDKLSLIWVVNKKNNWRNLVINGQKPVVVKNVLIKIDLAPGDYDVSFYSTFEGKQIQTSGLKVEKVPVTISLPDFTIDVFVKVIKMP
jgi:hypothetical protein